MKNMTINNGFYEDTKDILQKARDKYHQPIKHNKSSLIAILVVFN
jgi:hypothetical protein